MGFRSLLALFIISAVAGDPSGTPLLKPVDSPEMVAKKRQLEERALSDFITKTLEENVPSFRVIEEPVPTKTKTKAKSKAKPKPPVLKARKVPFEPQERETLIRAIHDNAIRWGKYFDMDPLLILGVMTVETHFVPGFKTKTGAIGLMQIEPVSVASLCVHKSIPCPPAAPVQSGKCKALKLACSSDATLAQISTNIEFGSRILADALECQISPELTKNSNSFGAHVAVYNKGCKGVDLALTGTKKKAAVEKFGYSREVIDAWQRLRADFISKGPFGRDPLPAPRPFIYPSQGQGPAPRKAN